MKKQVMKNWLIDEYKLQYTASKTAVEAKSHFEGRLYQLERILVNLFEVTVLRGTKNIWFNNKYGDVLGKIELKQD